MAGRTIGVDIGGTTTKLVCLQGSGSVVGRERIDSRREQAQELVDAVVATARPWLDGGNVAALGVAVPGLVDRDAGRILRGANLAYLDDFAVVDALNEATGLPVAIDNDANAAGLAEARLGAARGCASAVCLTVGFGVGGAVLFDGRLWRGHSGMAGELGRLVLDDVSGPTLEQAAAAAAIVSAYREGGGTVADDRDAATVAQRADEGDEAARQALATCGRRLGIGLAIIVNLLNPERIVVGGGIARSEMWYLDPARAEGRRRARKAAWERCEVVVAELGADAGAIGAALLCREGED